MIDRNLLKRLGWSDELIEAAVQVSDRVENRVITSIQGIPAIRAVTTGTVVANGGGAISARQPRSNDGVKSSRK